MKQALQQLESRYAALLQDCLAGESEWCLEQVYELGREAFGQGLGVTDLVVAHHEALADYLGRLASTEEQRAAVARAGPVIAECLSVFEMGLRGYQQANASLRTEILERQQLEEELRQATVELAQQKEELARSNKELEQFAYIASHDLKAPLRRIISLCQLLERRCGEQLDPDSQTLMQHIIDCGRQMQMLVDNLLAYSRVGTQSQPLQPVRCQAVLQQALSNLEAVIEETGARITHDPLPTVMADRTVLVQLLQNLIENAIVYRRGDEPPRIQVSARRQDGQWRFSVRDNGIGIEPRHFDEIFTMFKRLHSAARYAGTGLGLAICQKIVHRHGGRIWVDSQPGQGSTFHFTLPAAG